MNISLTTSAIFAQISRWRRLGDGIHRPRRRVDFDDLLPWILGMAILGIVAAIVMVIVKRNDFSKSCDDPKKLFRQLSKAHQLDFGSRRLLRQLADAFQLAQPAEIFLTPMAFEANRLPPHLRSEAGRIEQLHSRLF